MTAFNMKLPMQITTKLFGKSNAHSVKLFLMLIFKKITLIMIQRMKYCVFFYLQKQPFLNIVLSMGKIILSFTVRYDWLYKQEKNNNFVNAYYQNLKITKIISVRNNVTRLFITRYYNHAYLFPPGCLCCCLFKKFWFIATENRYAVF